MTLAPSTRSLTYNPTVATSAFDVTFPIFETDAIRVFIDGVETFSFSVTGVVLNGRIDNGQVVLSSAVAGKSVIIESDGTIEYGTSYEFRSPDFVEQIQQDMDEAHAFMQEIDRDVDRSIKVERGAPSPADFPAPETGKAIVGNVAGDGWENGPNVTDLSASVASLSVALDAEESARKAADEAERIAREGGDSDLAVSLAAQVDALKARDALLTGGVVPSGGWDASSGAFPAGAPARGVYVVTTAGTVDGQAFAVGDALVALVAGASTTTFAGNWTRSPLSTVLASFPKQPFVSRATMLAGNLAVGQMASDEWRGQTYLIVPAGTYTTGPTVFDLTVASGQAVLLSNQFDDVYDVIDDTRPIALLQSLYGVGGEVELYAEKLRWKVDLTQAASFDLTTPGGVELQVLPDRKGCVNVRQYGARVDSDGTTGNGTDDAVAINNAWTSALTNKWRCIHPVGTSRCGDNLVYSDDLDAKGVPGKSFVRHDFRATSHNGGDAAFVVPDTMGTGIDRAAGGTDGATNVRFSGITFGSTQHYFGATLDVNHAGKAVYLNGENIRFENGGIDRWGGFGITVAGNNIVVARNHFSNPRLPTTDPTPRYGGDGIHVVFAQRGVLIEGNTGITMDDMTSLAAARAGVFADQEVSGVTIRSNVMRSTHGRGCILGAGWYTGGVTAPNVALTKNSKNIILENNDFGAAPAASVNPNRVANGVIQVLCRDGAGVTEDVTIRGNILRCDGFLAPLSVVSTGDSIPIRNLVIEDNAFEGTDAQIGLDVRASIDGGHFRGRIDWRNATAGTASARHAIRFNPTDGTCEGFGFEATILANPNATAVVLATGLFDARDFDMRLKIRSVADGQTALQTSRLVNSKMHLTGRTLASSPTGTKGVIEGADSRGNIWAGSDLSDFNQPVVVAQSDSNWWGVEGLLATGFGADLTVSGGTLDAPTHHIHEVVVSGVTDLANIPVPAGLPIGSRLTITIDDGGPGDLNLLNTGNIRCVNNTLLPDTSSAIDLILRNPTTWAVLL